MGVGTNNFLQHNPNQSNQETDPAYNGDNIRTSGLGTDDIVPSPWMNKVLYQTTTFVAAFAQMMANKGYSMSDDDIVTLTNTLANVFTNADNKTPLVSVAFSANPTFNANLANGFDFVLNGNVASSSLINMAIGQVITFVITQPGGYTFTPPANTVGFQGIPSTAGVYVQSFIKNEAGQIVAYTGQPYYIPTAAQLGFVSGQNANGYWAKDPTGKLEQWGYYYGTIGGSFQSFPTNFNNAASISVSMTAIETGGELHVAYPQPNPNVNGFTFIVTNSDGDAVTIPGYFWRAVGY